MYYNQKGEKIGAKEFSELMAVRENKIVKQEFTKNKLWVSTVFLGLNYRYGEGAPIIYETMVFPSEDNLSDLDCRRYCTKEEALQGHKELFEEWKDHAFIPEVVD